MARDGQRLTVEALLDGRVAAPLQRSAPPQSARNSTIPAREYWRSLRLDARPSRQFARIRRISGSTMEGLAARPAPLGRASFKPDLGAFAVDRYPLSEGAEEDIENPM